MAPVNANKHARWQLYRLLAEPMRLRVLALASAQELSVGEISEALEQSQSNVSRYIAPLRDAGLVATRRHGKHVLIQAVISARRDPVVADALAAAQRLCAEDGSLSRVDRIIAARDDNGRAFFERVDDGQRPPQLAAELPSYALAMGWLLERRGLAVDAGTGDGALLDLLAPLFESVIAVDRSEAQLARARQRVQSRGYDNVRLVHSGAEGEVLRTEVGTGADLVMASRLLHHAPLPRETVRSLAGLVAPGGALLILDYARHDDEAFGEHQADVWLGFEPDELREFAVDAGLAATRVEPVPQWLCKSPLDGHLPWVVLVARRPGREEPVTARIRQEKT